ncbi:DAPG hydrolase family protein [Veronia pacifica]|uniref:DAPG hydrolase PhiG domain-containing protein n=1 Tax=Veronia pacifica TaxID=1080227 RepID=A0A1C3EPI5_9GAMM|nr:hypothetical protein [Veronia pacifica]ODA35171.1 hypothetical protein A8L45_04450 [Veronia pacifica]
MDDHKEYEISMEPIPRELEEISRKEIAYSTFPNIKSANEILMHWDTYSNRILRAPDGRVLVTCHTNMHDVDAKMIEWWFGWHINASSRYRLWHPKAHLKAEVKDDRSHYKSDRDKYIDNISYVDEYIGGKTMRLAIAFIDPADVGLEIDYRLGETAICAHTSDRVLKGDAGSLIHMIVPTVGGCEMRSIFWLGELNLKWPIIGRILKPIINTTLIRKFFVNDKLATDLFRHCAEEMSHLARFLPKLCNDKR